MFNFIDDAGRFQLASNTLLNPELITVKRWKLNWLQRAAGKLNLKANKTQEVTKNNTDDRCPYPRL